jgi:hypothetical protein
MNFLKIISEIYLTEYISESILEQQVNQIWYITFLSFVMSKPLFVFIIDVNK